MKQNFWDSGNRQFCLDINIKCKGVKKFRVVASDVRPNSKYADRVIEVTGERSIFLSFPVSPKSLILTVINIADPRDKDFELVFQESRLRDNGIWMDNETRSFYQMAIIVSQVMGFTKPQTYKSSDDLYTIKVFDVIRDYKSGAAMGTPARIGHSTGHIEASLMRMEKYTIPARVAIFGHEFSHVFKNPKMGLEIENETGADINMLYVYLGLGFSKVDAIYVFANVFYKAQTPGNIRRMRAIMDYIKKFDEKQSFG